MSDRVIISHTIAAIEPIDKLLKKILIFFKQILIYLFIYSEIWLFYDFRIAFLIYNKKES